MKNESAPLTLEGTVREGVQLNVKRFSLPGVHLRSTCPECSAPYDHDMEAHCLSYPTVGIPITVNAYCRECGAEWSPGEVILRVTLEKVE